jgi:hypothetical protein
MQRPIRSSPSSVRTRLARGCVYVKRLADVDDAALDRLVRAAWDQSLTTRKSYIDT